MCIALFTIPISPKLGSIRSIQSNINPIVPSGIKFIVLADPRQSGIDALLRKMYEIYSDFALKNPFYSLEMPIR